MDRAEQQPWSALLADTDEGLDLWRQVTDVIEQYTEHVNELPVAPDLAPAGIRNVLAACDFSRAMRPREAVAFAAEGLTRHQVHTPHPRYFGTFPRVLGRYVRDEHVLTLEDAIRKMTSANAAKVHQYDRGLLRPGMAADVTVFNAATIIDNATYEKPHQYATGVEYVIVNGKVVLDKGQHTGARPGAILYGPGK